MAGEPHERRQLAGILPILMESIARTADPDQALNHWERLLENVTRSTFLDYLRSSPRMLESALHHFRQQRFARLHHHSRSYAGLLAGGRRCPLEAVDADRAWSKRFGSNWPASP